MPVTSERLLYAALQAAVAGLAWTYAARRPAHRVVGLLFTWQLAANLARLAMAPVLDQADAPYAGAALALYYLDHALVLSFRFALLAAFWVHFAGGRARSAGLALGLALLALVIYKESTGASLEPAHALVAAAVSALCVVLAMQAMLAPADRVRVPDGAHAALMLLAAADVVNAALHYGAPVGASWSVVRATDTLVAGVLALGYAGALGRKVVLAWRGTSLP